MTAQISDSFLFQDKTFSIAGVNGTGLFDPQAYALRPLPRITSCWRGFVCTYKTSHGKLILDALQINLGTDGPLINDIHPEFSTKNTFDNLYGGLDLRINFTGGILIADGFIRELYVHMGFHPAWKYETVYELSISGGAVLETKDVSLQMADLRAKLARQPLQPGTETSAEELEAWIASTFGRSYRF